MQGTVLLYTLHQCSPFHIRDDIVCLYKTHIATMINNNIWLLIILFFFFVFATNTLITVLLHNILSIFLRPWNFALCGTFDPSYTSPPLNMRATGRGEKITLHVIVVIMDFTWMTLNRIIYCCKHIMRIEYTLGFDKSWDVYFQYQHPYVTIVLLHDRSNILIMTYMSMYEEWWNSTFGATERLQFNAFM